jgi:glycosyltransferase involved in cell wall biosynthesis
MRVTYVGRSFLDYRIPVLAELKRSLGDGFSLIYCADYVPERVQKKAQKALGDHAIGLTGERRLGRNVDDRHGDWANASVRVVYQPGLLKRIAETRPDVLLGDGFFQWTPLAIAYKLRHGTPLVLTYERTAHTERHAQWYRRVYRRAAIKFVDAMACNGQLSKNYAVSLGMPAGRITVGQMVADVKGMQTSADEVSPEDRRSIRWQWGDPEVAFIGVGRLFARKGWSELLRGWARLPPEYQRSCRLVIVGEGPEEERLNALVRELRLSGVILAGHVAYDEMARLYAAADAMVMPTLEDNWSLVVPEAMACGLPVLCSRYNGCHPELVQEDRNGWVFDPLDADDTMHTLRLCLDARDRLSTMGDASRRIVAEHSPAHAAEALLEACRLSRERKV